MARIRAGDVVARLRSLEEKRRPLNLRLPRTLRSEDIRALEVTLDKRGGVHRLSKVGWEWAGK